MRTDQARIIAKLAHRGQPYGATGDYFNDHVMDVVARCQRNAHCTNGCVTVAYLHDVVEDTDVSMQDLRDAGLFGAMETSLEAITKRVDEDYAAYMTRVLKDHYATFVKYHDLRSNIDACLRTIKGAGSGFHVDQARKLLNTRYTPAIERIIASEPYWLYEGCNWENEND